MKKQVQKFIIFIILISFLITPTFALAAWWNPFSWHIWDVVYNVFFHKQNSTIETNIQKTQNSIDNTSNTTNSNTQSATTGTEKNSNLGNCYDTSKTCSQLGGVLTSYNNCKGDVVGSSDTLAKGITDICCVGEQKGLSCVAKLGQLSDTCDVSCNKCYCGNSATKTSDITPQQDFLSQVDLLGKVDTWQCLILPGTGENVWVSTKYYVKKDCSEGLLTSGYCKCGNYYCGITSGSSVWNKCVNKVCLASSGKTCNYDTQCNDNDVSTVDKCSSAGQNLEGICSNVKITSCTNNDGYCPSNCTYNNDSDCKRKCSDGTEIGKCSTNKPKMCGYNGITGTPMFVDDCKTCGCASGLSCDSKSSLCYNASAQTQYIFTNSDFQSVGYDGSKFINSTSTQSTSSGQTVILYRQEAEYYKVQIIHYQGNSASSVYDSDLAFYQIFKPTTLKTNEYGDRSIRMKISGTSGVEGGLLLIQTGNDELEFVYLSSDETKINSLVQAALNKIK